MKAAVSINYDLVLKQSPSKQLVLHIALANTFIEYELSSSHFILW